MCAPERREMNFTVLLLMGIFAVLVIDLTFRMVFK
nr:MAG TPA: hypothetical protein [Inoviridae sp.]